MCSQFRSPRVSSVEYRRPRPANCNDSLSPQGLAAVGLYEVGERWLMNRTLSDEKERKRKSGETAVKDVAMCRSTVFPAEGVLDSGVEWCLLLCLFMLLL